MNIDLFAGPGGWDIALRQLGDEAVGIEKDPVTCATRAAAWPHHHPRWRSMADVTGWPGRQLVGFPRRADTARARTVNGLAYRARDLRPAAHPAFAITEKARSWTRDGQPVTVAEAALLQGFPPHPWQGSRTHQFVQLANAVPPPVAGLLLRSACLPERAVLR